MTTGFELTAVSVSRGEQTILHGVDLIIDRPATVITGPSGSGKTTLLRLLNGLDSPTSGAIRYDGQGLDAWAPRLLRVAVGHVQQQPPALTTSGHAELALAAELAGASRDAEREASWIERLDLAPLLDRNMADLSVGERQRLALVRALTARPKALILDEPTSAQDEGRAQAVHRLLADEMQAGLQLIIVEHKLAALDVYPESAVARVSLEGGRVQP